MGSTAFDRVFNRTAASNLARRHGLTDVEDAQYIPLGNDPETVDLAFVVVGDERRSWEKNERHGLDVKYVREGWLIVDPNNPQYCGITGIDLGATLIILGVAYTITDATTAQQLIDFRLTRIASSELSRPSLRGQQ